MKQSKGPKAPPERHKTIRQEIIEVLKQQTFSAKGISASVGITEKAVYGHLEHIRKSVKLNVFPAECKICGFVFKDRKKLHKPGKCPKCRNSSIEDPYFSVKKC